MAKKKNKANVQKNKIRKKQRTAARKKQKKNIAATHLKFMGVGRRAIREAPIHEIIVPEDIQQQDGIGYVMVSRIISPGQIAAGVFLIDIYCLGAKNTFINVLSTSEYGKLCEDLTRGYNYTYDKPPSYARKFVDDAVAYARNLGFNPGDDFNKTYTILEDIDSATCRDNFTFGKEGKPFFVSGPNDTPAKSLKIMKTLEAHCGSDGYHYMLGGPIDNDWLDDE